MFAKKIWRIYVFVFFYYIYWKIKRLKEYYTTSSSLSTSATVWLEVVLIPIVVASVPGSDEVVMFTVVEKTVLLITPRWGQMLDSCICILRIGVKRSNSPWNSRVSALLYMHLSNLSCSFDRSCLTLSVRLVHPPFWNVCIECTGSRSCNPISASVCLVLLQ